MSHIERNYKIKFIMCFTGDLNSNSHNYNKYYMPRWGKFMRALMPRKLSNNPNSKTASFSELPLLRKLVNKKVTAEIVAPLLDKKDKDLNRILLEVAPLFDISSSDMKCHILAVFGVTSSELEDHLENSDFYSN